MSRWPRRARSITLGTHGPFFFRRRLHLAHQEAGTHTHCLGTSGSGKSRWLASFFLSLLDCGLSGTLVDPHGDTAQLVLSHLIKRGYFEQEGYHRLFYLDLPGAERRGLFLPFNFLRQPLPAHTIASNVKEALHRAWPSLSGGAAPMFDTLVQDGVKVLISNGLPLTALFRLLTDQDFRDGLLAREDDPEIIAFFRQQFDRLSERDRADQAGAALRRAHLLTFAPILKYSLAQRENALPFRAILDEQTSIIINLALADGEARRLLGCLLTVSLEQASLSRANLPPSQRAGSHHLIIDEFSEFTAQSEESLSRVLSLCRKYGLFLVMAHQTWSQTSERLRGAMQNAGLEVVFRLGRADAEHSASILGRVNPLAVKHEVENENAIERTHPVFYSLPEQWESWVQAIQDLPPRQAFIRTPGGTVRRVHSPSVPDVSLHPHRLQEVEEHYLTTLFRPKHVIERELTSYRPSETPIPVRRTRLAR